MKQAMQFALRLYKRLISPMLPHSCRFVPTCSEYAMEAVERHGAARGSLLAAARLLRCHPFARSGYDPVPLSVDAKQVAKSDSARATRSESLEVV
jgi:putative membrane protein insertion efficiency factor